MAADTSRMDTAQNILLTADITHNKCYRFGLAVVIEYLDKRAIFRLEIPFCESHIHFFLVGL